MVRYWPQDTELVRYWPQDTEMVRYWPQDTEMVRYCLQDPEMVRQDPVQCMARMADGLWWPQSSNGRVLKYRADHMVGRVTQ